MTGSGSTHTSRPGRGTALVEVGAVVPAAGGRTVPSGSGKSVGRSGTGSGGSSESTPGRPGRPVGSDPELVPEPVPEPEPEDPDPAAEPEPDPPPGAVGS